MEDDSGQEKTEQPTQKRLDKAEEDGHILRSQEFTIAILVLGCLLLLITQARILLMVCWTCTKSTSISTGTQSRTSCVSILRARLLR